MEVAEQNGEARFRACVLHKIHDSGDFSASVSVSPSYCSRLSSASLSDLCFRRKVSVGTRPQIPVEERFNTDPLLLAAARVIPRPDLGVVVIRFHLQLQAVELFQSPVRFRHCMAASETPSKTQIPVVDRGSCTFKYLFNQVMRYFNRFKSIYYMFISEIRSKLSGHCNRRTHTVLRPVSSSSRLRSEYPSGVSTPHLFQVLSISPMRFSMAIIKPREFVSSSVLSPGCHLDQSVVSPWFSPVKNFPDGFFVERNGGQRQRTASIKIRLGRTLVLLGQEPVHVLNIFGPFWPIIWIVDSFGLFANGPMSPLPSICPSMDYFCKPYESDP